MRHVIPFICHLQNDEISAWLSALHSAMPAYTFKIFEQLSSSERQDATVAITANPKSSELLQLPNLRWVQCLWAGVESLVNSELSTEIDIVRLIDPRLSETMTEAALACTFYLHRDMPNYQQQQILKNWQQKPVKLAGERSVGILGLGKLGNGVARALSNNGFKVSGWSRSANKNKELPIDYYDKRQGLREMLNKTEILIILLPLTDATSGLLNHEVLALLPPKANIINFARGQIIDDNALLGYLDADIINHAVLDVFNQEPLPNDHRYWNHPKVTVWPHVAAPTNKESAVRIVAENLDHYFANGTVPESVNRDLQY